MILDLLRSHGGSSSVEEVGNTDYTKKHLRLLERAGLIERLDEPDVISPGVWKLAETPDPQKQFRSCGFCGKRVSYDDHEDGSVCFEGVCACADCLKTEKTSTFRLLLDEENIAYEARFKEKNNHG